MTVGNSTQLRFVSQVISVRGGVLAARETRDDPPDIIEIVIGVILRRDDFALYVHGRLRALTGVTGQSAPQIIGKRLDTQHPV